MTSRIVTLALLLAAAPLAALGQPAPVNRETLSAALDAANSITTTCDAQVDATPESALLKPKLPGIAEETVEQLMDTSFATDEQVAALKVYYPRHQACQIGGENQIVKAFPGSGMAFVEMDHQMDQAYADLENKKLGWGDFLLKRKSIQDNWTLAFSAALQAAGVIPSP